MPQQFRVKTYEGLQLDANAFDLIKPVLLSPRSRTTSCWAIGCHRIVQSSEVWSLFRQHGSTQKKLILLICVDLRAAASQHFSVAGSSC
jgi:hypothetical protein